VKADLLTFPVYSREAEIIRSAKQRGLGAIGICDFGSTFKAAVSDAEVLGEHLGVRVFVASRAHFEIARVIFFGAPTIGVDLSAPSAPICALDWARAAGGATAVDLLPATICGSIKDEVLEGRWDWWIRKADALVLTWASDRGDDYFTEEIAERLSKRVVKVSGAAFAGNVGGSRGEWHEEVPDGLRAPGDLVEWLRRG